MGIASKALDLILWVLAKFFPIKSAKERAQEKVTKKLNELEEYHRFLENKLSVAIIKKKGMEVAMLRRELRDVVNDVMRLRTEAARHFKPQ
jgi:K+-sensing histidine kinase KdpD